MPNRKQVVSLQSICLSKLSRVENDAPFATLPYCILNKIVNKHDYSVLLQPHQLDIVIDQYTNHLEMAINRYTTQLDFYNKKHCIIDRGIELILTLRPTLTHLKLRESKITEDNLKALMNIIPNIKFLNLKSTSTTDEVLTIIGTNCPKLRELNLKHCSITDIGIKALCEKSSGSGQCRLISKLNVNHTLITNDGIATIICNLPHLSTLHNINVMHILETVQDYRTLQLPLKLDRIFHECNTNNTISDFTIQVAANMCQEVTTITLMSLTRNDQWLRRLSNFHQLCDLTLSSSIEDHLSFNEYLLPILKNIGNNLRSLTMCLIDDINLWYIGIYCPQLTNLFIFQSNRYSSEIPVNINDYNQPLFTQLLYVNINFIDGNELPLDQLETLLSNCHLVRSLSFDMCQLLTDELLERVWQRNSFADLYEFILSNCDNIHKSSLFWIINNCELLMDLAYSVCASITDADHQEIERFIKLENFDMYLWH